MSGHTSNLSLSLGVIWLLVAACDAGPGQANAPAKTPEAPAKPAPAKPAEPAKAAPTTPAVKLAEVRDDVPLPLKKFLGKPVADAQAQLGEHLGKGMARSTCVRFVPERTFYGCQFALQRYADKTGTFNQIQVEYEDGVVAAIAFDGWKAGSGAFDPRALLAAVGLTLPEAGDESTPEGGVRLWRWFNNKARVVLDGKQYRVEVSVVEDKWERSRVQVILNHPLTPAQTAKIVPPGNGGAAISEPPPETAPAKAG